MRRYYPPGQGMGPVQTDGVRRIGIAEWRLLWRNDRTEWLREIRDRPKRFDPWNWQRALRIWRNDVPRVHSLSEGDLPLEGVPMLVKDLYDVPGEPTTCGSAVLLSGDGPEAPAASAAGPLIDRMVRAGASVTGRTQMNEFAYGLDGRNRFTGNCPHPFADRRISGGSSSGSAWAVAAGIVPVALGTDTGGSIRLPAALCGIYGVRLGWSGERLGGVFPLAASMDTVGWFTQSIEDMETVLDVVLPEAQPPGTPEHPWRVAAIVPPGIDLTSEMTAIWEDVKRRMTQVGMVLSEETAPDFLGDPAVDAYNVIGSSEAWAVHKKWIEQYGDLYDPIVRGLIERGKHWSEEGAHATRERIRRYADELFERYDAVMLPATVIPSPTVDEADGDFRAQTLRLNTLGSLAQLPALSLPIHLDAVRSGGVQILVSPTREDSLSRFLSVWRELV
jgi:Asp-tRNA(Asn)/Glu-tRNA(Gln) amidotransferase A subunit family amidase